MQLPRFNSWQLNALAFVALLIFISIATISNKIKRSNEAIAPISSDMTIVGGCAKETSPYLENNITHNVKITYCASGDRDKGTIKVGNFRYDGNFTIYTAGYFNENVYLSFKLNGKSIYPNSTINPNPGEKWTAQDIDFSSKEKGILEISLIDNGASYKEWGGVSTPLMQVPHKKIIDQVNALLILIIFITVSLAITYSSFLFITKFTSDNGIIAPSIFIVLCCTYYISFWIYYLSHNLGLLYSYLILSLSILILFKSLFNGEYYKNLKTSSALKIYCLPILYTLLLFSFSIAYGDLHSIQRTAAITFTHELPVDNFLPKIFADQIYTDSLRTPMIGDWLSSDRPPLQAGQALFFFKLFSGSDAGYQLMAMSLQAYFLIPVILFLNYFSINNQKIRFLILCVLAFSSVALVNTLYVWPKLVAGAALLLATYTLLESNLFKSKLIAITLSSALAMIAMLSHPGSVFSILSIALISLIMFKPNLKEIFAATAIALAMLGPWILYQKHIDPPGNRLVKWHLAGEVAVNDKTLSESIKDAYTSKPPEDIINIKANNFRNLFSGVITQDYFRVPLSIVKSDKSNQNFTSHIKSKMFFHFFYSMGIIFTVGFFLLFYFLSTKKNLKTPKNYGFLLASSLIALIVWSILMFENESTVIHQGSYYPWLAIMLVFSIYIFLFFKELSIYIFVAQLIVSISIYFLSVIRYYEITNFLFFVTFLLSFIVFIWLSFKFVRQNEPHSLRTFICLEKK